MIVGILVVGAIVIYSIIDVHLFAVEHKLGIPEKIFRIVDAFFKEYPVLHDERTLIDSAPQPVGDDVLADKQFEQFPVSNIKRLLEYACFSIAPLPVAAINQVGMATICFFCQFLHSIFRQHVVAVGKQKIIACSRHQCRLSCGTHAPVSVVVDDTYLLCSFRIFLQERLQDTDTFIGGTVIYKDVFDRRIRLLEQ